MTREELFLKQWLAAHSVAESSGSSVRQSMAAPIEHIHRLVQERLRQHQAPSADELPPDGETRELRRPQARTPASSQPDPPVPASASPPPQTTETAPHRRGRIRRPPPPQMTRPRTDPVLRTLFLGADVDPQRRLRIDRELREIGRSFEVGQRLHQVELNLEVAVRVDDLQKLFLRHRPKLVHVAAHGGLGHLLMDGELHGETVALEPFCNLLTQSAAVRCVVLNACHSEAAAPFLLRRVDTAVVAMNRAITDRAAIHFAMGFYIALAFGETVESAFEQGRLLLQMKKQAGTDIPRLLGSNKARARRFFESP